MNKPASVPHMNTVGDVPNPDAGPLSALAPLRVLVVDDDPASLRVMLLQLRNAGVHTESADSAFAAQTLLQLKGTDGFDAIVTDFNMPEMDGAQLLAWVRSVDPTLAAIMLTAVHAREVVVGSLRAGVVDFLEKPCPRELMHAAVARAVRQTRQQRAFRATELEVEKLVALTPILNQSAAAGPARRWGRAEVNLPIRQAGGDFTMHCETDSGQTVIFVGDVSGHDLRAAYVGAYFQGMARGLCHEGVSLAATFQLFNRILVEEFNRSGCPLSLAVTAIALDWQAGEAEVLIAGLPLPMRIAPDGGLSPVGEPTHPLGWFEDWQGGSVRFDLASTRWLYVWSDGLEDFAVARGIDRYAAAHRLLTEPNHAQRQHLAADRTDDVLVLRLGDDHGLDAVPLLDATYGCADLRLIDLHQRFWDRSLAFALPAIPEHRRLDWLLATREALLNALHHGCRHQAGGTVRLRIFLDIAPARLRILVDDPGPGYAPGQTTPRPGHESWGLKFITELADKVEKTRHGASLVIHFDLAAPAPPRS